MRGVAYYHTGEHERAIEDHTAALQAGLLPRYVEAEAYSWRAGSYLETDRHELAIEDYNHALFSGQTTGEVTAAAQFGRGYAYFRTGDYERAARDLVGAGAQLRIGEDVRQMKGVIGELLVTMASRNNPRRDRGPGDAPATEPSHPVAAVADRSHGALPGLDCPRLAAPCSAPPFQRR
jgi:hypothetical protein